MRRRVFLKKFLACMVLFFWTPFLCGLLFWKMEVKKTPKWEQNTENPGFSGGTKTACWI